MTLEKLKELAEESWVGCDGCTETDEYFWKKGFQAGYNRAKPEEISDEEIDKAAELKYPFDTTTGSELRGMIVSAERGGFYDGVKWVIEQLKSRQ